MAHSALARGEAALAAALAEGGVDLFELNDEGQSLVLAATLANNYGCLRLLLEANALPDFTATESLTSSSLPAASPTGAPPQLQHRQTTANLAHNTPLICAAHKGHERCLELLLMANADVDATDEHLRSPALLAASSGHEACLRQLIAAGANVDHFNSRGMSALFRACEEGHAPCVTILIQAKADVNLADKSGRTPAYVCAQLNKTSCLEALIIGADPNLRQRNNNGRSPLMIARAMRNYSAAAVLALATLEHDEEADHLVPSRQVALFQKPRRRPLRGLTRDARELKATVHGDRFMSTLPFAFVRKPLATAYAVVHLVVALRKQERYVTAYDERGGEMLLDAAFRVQSILIAMLTTLDDAEFASLILPPRGDTSLLDATISADCKMLLAFPRIQRLLQEDWALVLPHHVQHFASSQWYGEDAAAAAVANAAGPSSEEDRATRDELLKVVERRVSQRSSYGVLVPRLAFAVLHNLALLACEAVWPPMGAKVDVQIIAAKEAAVQRVAARNPEPLDFDADGVKTFVLDGVVVSRAMASRSAEDQIAKRDLWVHKMAEVKEDEARMEEFRYPLFQPLGTFIIHLASRIYLSVLLTSLPPVGDEPFWYLVWLFGWALQNWVIQLRAAWTKPGLWLANVFNVLELGAMTCVLIGLGMRTVNELQAGQLTAAIQLGTPGKKEAPTSAPTWAHTLFKEEQLSAIRRSQAFLAVGIGTQWVAQWCKLLQVTATFGPLVLMALEMVKDCVLFLTMLSGVFLGFSVALVTLLAPIEQMGGGAHIPASVGYATGEAFHHGCGELFGFAFESESHRFWALWKTSTVLLQLVLGSDSELAHCLQGHALAPVVLDAFRALVILMALNMLIAQMSTTYERIRERLATNFMFLTAMVVVSTMNAAHVPPPFTMLSWPYLLAKGVAAAVIEPCRLALWPAMERWGCARFFGYRTLGEAEAAQSDHASTEGWIDGDKILAEEDALREKVAEFLETIGDSSEFDERWKARQSRQLGLVAKTLNDLDNRLHHVGRRADVSQQRKAVEDSRQFEAVRAEMAEHRQILERLLGVKKKQPADLSAKRQPQPQPQQRPMPPAAAPVSSPAVDPNVKPPLNLMEV